MVRILAVVLWIAVTIYAIADWARTPDEEVPGRIGRMWWLTIIVITMPFISIGSIVWILLRTITRAESGESTRFSDFASESNPLLTGWSRRPERPKSSQRSEPLAPDDDPEFLFRLERDIQRRRHEAARAEESRGDRGPSDDSDSDVLDERDYEVPPTGSGSASGPGSSSGHDSSTDAGASDSDSGSDSDLDSDSDSGRGDPSDENPQP